jgi:hypothetical protein
MPLSLQGNDFAPSRRVASGMLFPSRVHQKEAAMNIVKRFAGIVLAGAALAASAAAIELHPDTLRAWDTYLHRADSRLQSRLDAHHTYLWADEEPGRAARLRAGEILVTPMAGRAIRGVPDGLIHDWLGAVFIPNATISGLLAVVHDYDRYKDFYKPTVADSKILACTDTEQQFSMTWQRHVLFVNAAMQGQYEAHDHMVDAHRGYSIAGTTEVREIKAYGLPGQAFLPPGQGNGFIWRLHSIARFAERDGGVYLELEAIALTRDIPLSLRWVVNPVVNHLSVGSLTTTLQQTRDAVEQLASAPQHYASCAFDRRAAATH